MRPRMGGYWFGPSISAREAASRIDFGPSSSGKPWPRLTAPCRAASADMWVKIVVGREEKTGLDGNFDMAHLGKAGAADQPRSRNRPPARFLSRLGRVRRQSGRLCTENGCG